jgi:hypothetical protein
MCHPSDRDRPLALVAFLGSALLAAFWALYGCGVLRLGEPGSAATMYEAAFPFADLFAAGLLLVAGVGLWRGRALGRFAMIAGASMVLYLGLLDFTFYSRQGLFARLQGEGALELALCATCCGGGALSLVRCWRRGRTS